MSSSGINLAFVLAAIILALVHNLIWGPIKMGPNKAVYHSVELQKEKVLSVSKDSLKALAVKTVKKQL